LFSKAADLVGHCRMRTEFPSNLPFCRTSEAESLARVYLLPIMNSYNLVLFSIYGPARSGSRTTNVPEQLLTRTKEAAETSSYLSSRLRDHTVWKIDRRMAMRPKFQDLHAGVWKKRVLLEVEGCGTQAIRKGKLTDYCCAFQLDFCQGCVPESRRMEVQQHLSKYPLCALLSASSEHSRCQRPGH
jgi:hypothetical protein